MKNKKPDAAQIWKQLEDLLVPRLRLSITDRAVYSHLLRHSRLEGRARLRFSIASLARGARLCTNSARWSLRRLIAHAALRLLERGKAGHVVEVRLPHEIRAVRPARIRRRPRSTPHARPTAPPASASLVRPPHAPAIPHTGSRPHRFPPGLPRRIRSLLPVHAALPQFARNGAVFCLAHHPPVSDDLSQAMA